MLTHLGLLQLLQLMLLQLLFDLLLLCLLCVRRGDGISAEWQETTADAAGSLADLPAQAGIAEQPANTATDQTAERGAQQAAEDTLRGQLRPCADTIVLKFIHESLQSAKGELVSMSPNWSIVRS